MRFARIARKKSKQIMAIKFKHISPNNKYKMASFLTNVKMPSPSAIKNSIGKKISSYSRKSVDKLSREYVSAALADITLKDCDKFIPAIRWAKVVKVYDGDTITIAACLDDKCYKFSTRILGIDTPEIRGKSVREKALAIEARDYLKTMIFEKMVELRDVSYDKYGRLLANVFFEDKSISEILIEKNYAVAYDGGTKTHDFSK